MTRTIAALLGLALISCGGGKKESKQPVAPPPEPVVKAEPEPEPPPPPPPKKFSAKAALTPVKGAKIAAVTVSFAQEGESTKVTTEIEGLKAGKYHLVIHENAECGPNATKVGAVWPGGANAPLSMNVVKGAIGEIDESVALPIDGDASIVGHTLVLHEDKKGAPGKAVACGTIDKAGDDAAATPPAE